MSVISLAVVGPLAIPCESVQKCVEGNMEVHRDAQRGEQECAEVCRICGVAQKCVESAQ